MDIPVQIYQHLDATVPKSFRQLLRAKKSKGIHIIWSC